MTLGRSVRTSNLRFEAGRKTAGMRLAEAAARGRALTCDTRDTVSFSRKRQRLVKVSSRSNKRSRAYHRSWESWSWSGLDT